MSQKIKKEKKKKREAIPPLGKRLGVYHESRLALALVIIGIIGGLSAAIFFNFNQGRSPWMTGFGVGIFFTLPAILVGIAIWVLYERRSPRKALVFYEEGLRVVTKHSVASYQWEAIPNIIRIIVKEEESRKVLRHEYTFRERDGNKALSFNSNSYPGFNSDRFDKVLKQAHVKGAVNLDTRIEWESRNSD